MNGLGDKLLLGKSRSLQRVAAAYITAVFVAALVAWCVGSEHPVTALAAADLAATLIVFAFSMAWHNSSVYDPYWSVIPPLMVLYWAALAAPESVSLRQVVVAVLVFSWGIRLTSNWVRGWPGLHHEDWRYVDLYANSPLPPWMISLLGIQIFPTVQVFLAALPLMPAVAVGTHPFGFLDIVALLVTGGAIIIETVADEQLHTFARTKREGEIIADGLWAFSRHPNYFGEVSFWWGLWLFALAADPGWWWTGIGAVSMTAMFVFVSIPMLDRRSCQRRPGYEQHMRQVSALAPWFRKNGSDPSAVDR